MSRGTTVIAFRQPEAIDDPLSELAREGARHGALAAMRPPRLLPIDIRVAAPCPVGAGRLKESSGHEVHVADVGSQLGKAYTNQGDNVRRIHTRVIGSVGAAGSTTRKV
jgi:hypothetical protein